MDTHTIIEFLKDLWSERSFRMQAIAGLLLMAVTIPLTMWAFDTEHPFEFDAENSFVVPNLANSGDQMLVMWKLKKPPRKGCTGEVRRTLIDPDTKVLIAAYDREKSAIDGALLGDYLTKTFRLPVEMPRRGWIAYKSDLCYACNPLQEAFTAARICYLTPELLFKVL